MTDSQLIEHTLPLSGDLPSEPPRKGRPRNDGRAPIGREQIITAARALFVKLGVAGTSVRMIANDIGSHTASIFHHFPTKEHIVAAVAEGIYSSELERFAVIVDLGLAPDVTLFKLVRDDAVFAAMGEEAQRRLFLLPEMRTEQFPEVSQLWRRMVSFYADVITAGMAARVFAACEPRIVAEFIATVPIVSIISWSPEALGSPRDNAINVARFVLRSVLADQARLPEVEAAALKIRLRKTS